MLTSITLINLYVMLLSWGMSQLIFAFHSVPIYESVCHVISAVFLWGVQQLLTSAVTLQMLHGRY